MTSNNIDNINLAIQTNDEELYKKSLPDSIDYGVAYLLSRYTTDSNQAYDCVMAVIERLLLKFDSLAGDKDFNFASYFIESCKNQYFSDKRKLKRNDPLIDTQDIFDRNEGIYDILFDREQKEMLRRCIKKLNDHQYNFITWLFQNPDADAVELEGRFSISMNAVYQKKHRIVRLLQKCIGFFT